MHALYKDNSIHVSLSLFFSRCVIVAVNLNRQQIKKKNKLKSKNKTMPHDTLPVCQIYAKSTLFSACRHLKFYQVMSAKKKHKFAMRLCLTSYQMKEKKIKHRQILIQTHTQFQMSEHEGMHK